MPSGLIANGNFDAQLLRVVALGAWHGVTTNGAGRVTALDLSGTGVCAPPDDACITAWLASIRTAGGSATVDVCVAAPPPFPPAPVIAIPYARVTLGADTAGDAPDGAVGRAAGIAVAPRYTSRAAWWPEWMAISSQRGASASPTTRTSPS